jgi:Zn-dependent M28 family amino/carboxypeptidase
VKFLLVVLILAVLAVVALAYVTMAMPGKSYRGALEGADRGVAGELRRDVETLCANGPRNVFVPHSLRAAALHIERSFETAGYKVEKQPYVVDGVVCENLSVEIRGTAKPAEIVVIGAHYDSVDGSPGADDNASGVAALLALARRMRDAKPARTLRFVAFVNEEPPHFKTADMGSHRYATAAKQRGDNVVAMLSLETLGYYDDRPGAQRYPPPLDRFLPKEGNFIAFAGNLGSRELVRRCVAIFREQVKFPAEGAALPEAIQEIGWSDQWSFWQQGWKGLMVTDTALFRNPHYHTPHDTPDTLDYDRMARVVDGLRNVVNELTK